MSLGSLLRYIGVTLGVLGSFMKHLGRQNRKRHVYDGDMVVYSGTMGDCWRVMVAKREAKDGPATNLQDFGATLGALWGHFWLMKVTYGDLEDALGLP